MIGPFCRGESIRFRALASPGVPGEARPRRRQIRGQLRVLRYSDLGHGFAASMCSYGSRSDGAISIRDLPRFSWAKEVPFVPTRTRRAINGRVCLFISHIHSNGVIEDTGVILGGVNKESHTLVIFPS